MTSTTEVLARMKRNVDELSKLAHSTAVEDAMSLKIALGCDINIISGYVRNPLKCLACEYAAPVDGRHVLPSGRVHVCTAHVP